MLNIFPFKFSLGLMIGNGCHIMYSVVKFSATEISPPKLNHENYIIYDQLSPSKILYVHCTTQILGNSFEEVVILQI